MKTIARAALASLLFLAAFNLSAAMVRKMPITELAGKSDLVVHGHVLGQSCHRDSDGSIYTTVNISIAEVWKGTLKTNALTVVQGGGTVGNVRLAVSGQAEYTAGEEVVLFLVINPAGEPVSLGLAQGKFHVWRDSASGVKFAGNPIPGDSESDGVESADDPKPSPLPLSELRQQVLDAQP